MWGLEWCNCHQTHHNMPFISWVNLKQTAARKRSQGFKKRQSAVSALKWWELAGCYLRVLGVLHGGSRTTNCMLPKELYGRRGSQVHYSVDKGITNPSKPMFDMKSKFNGCGGLGLIWGSTSSIWMIWTH